jgi:lipoprotein Spr
MQLLKYAFILLSFSLIGCGSSNIPDFKEDDVTPPSKAKVLPIQKKYAAILGVPENQAKSIDLYRFIDSWMGTTYKMGGENKAGIDCSYFSQFLYHDVYDTLIERTAEKQYLAPNSDKFIGQEYIREGDLLFFNLSGSQDEKITHVGVYIGHNKFVHSTSRRTPEGHNGVQISDFKDPHWQRLFVAAARKTK